MPRLTRRVVGMIEPGSNARFFLRRMELAEWLERPWRCKMFGHAPAKVVMHDADGEPYFPTGRMAWECKREGCAIWLGWAEGVDVGQGFSAVEL